MNPFAVLQVEPGVTMAELTRAHRRLAKLWHPDLYTGYQVDLANEHMSRVNTAYDALRRKCASVNTHSATREAGRRQRKRSSPRARAFKPGAFRHVFHTGPAAKPANWWDLPSLLIALQAIAFATCALVGLWPTWAVWLAILLPTQILALLTMMYTAPDKARAFSRPGRKSVLQPLIVCVASLAIVANFSMTLLVPFFVIAHEYAGHVGA